MCNHYKTPQQMDFEEFRVPPPSRLYKPAIDPRKDGPFVLDGRAIVGQRRADRSTANPLCAMKQRRPCALAISVMLQVPWLMPSHETTSASAIAALARYEVAPHCGPVIRSPHAI